MGTVETVPGVSGGTVALVVGVYETLITSAGHLLSGVRRAVVDVPRGRGTERAAAELRRVHWRVVVPLLIGMAAALVLMARLIEGFVEDQPIQSRALFFGLVLASVWVPFSLASRATRTPRSDDDIRADGRWSGRDYLVGAGAAAAAFLVVSIPPGNVDPSKPMIMFAAAIAVSALILPGLSGSFILLTFGLYEATLSALNDRDLGFLAFFAAGATIGLASFVKLLQWVLEHHRRVTLVVLTGVMVGCLRALWPWQDDDRALQAPDEHIAAAAGLAALGFAAVLAVLAVERRVTGRLP
ncbi:DUF368 domain-containing protein [Phytoactinopolyspora halotolerans]|uniref:DUF368 domain-containing protein n=1 Tax=Phytoactinopolyspora halotolerans TaxID=1981512 RepID=A0A6L9SCT2_9ACTN|nr:DUF368 domain-containing protein [Phytoactinopolyspora halotolerans]